MPETVSGSPVLDGAMQEAQWPGSTPPRQLRRCQSPPWLLLPRHHLVTFCMSLLLLSSLSPITNSMSNLFPSSSFVFVCVRLNRVSQFLTLRLSTPLFFNSSHQTQGVHFPMLWIWAWLGSYFQPVRCWQICKQRFQMHLHDWTFSSVVQLLPPEEHALGVLQVLREWDTDGADLK